MRSSIMCGRSHARTKGKKSLDIECPEVVVEPPAKYMISAEPILPPVI